MDYFEDNQYICFIMELMKSDAKTIKVELLDDIRLQDYPFKEHMIKCLFKKMLQTMHELHKNNKILGDISLSNFLVDFDGKFWDNDFKVKLTGLEYVMNIDE